MKCVDAFPLLPPAIREQIGVEYFECAAAHKEILDSVRNGITCPAYEVLNLQLCGAVMPVTRAFALSCNFPQEHPDVVWGGGPMPPPGPRKVITKEAIEHRNWRDMLGFDDGHTKYYSLDSKWLSNNPHRLPVPKEGDPRGWAPPPVAGTDPLAASGAFIYQESATAYGVEIGVTYRSDVTYSGPYGDSWLLSFHQRLEEDPGSVRVIIDDQTGTIRQWQPDPHPDLLWHRADFSVLRFRYANYRVDSQEIYIADGPGHQVLRRNPSTRMSQIIDPGTLMEYWFRFPPVHTMALPTQGTIGNLIEVRRPTGQAIRVYWQYGSLLEQSLVEDRIVALETNFGNQIQHLNLIYTPHISGQFTRYTLACVTDGATCEQKQPILKFEYQDYKDHFAGERGSWYDPDPPNFRISAIFDRANRRKYLTYADNSHSREWDNTPPADQDEVIAYEVPGETAHCEQLCSKWGSPEAAEGYDQLLHVFADSCDATVPEVAASACLAHTADTVRCAPLANYAMQVPGGCDDPNAYLDIRWLVDPQDRSTVSGMAGAPCSDGATFHTLLGSTMCQGVLRYNGTVYGSPIPGVSQCGATPNKPSLAYYYSSLCANQVQEYLPDLPKMREEQCLKPCKERMRSIYGKSSDARNLLTEVTEEGGRVLVHNVYQIDNDPGPDGDGRRRPDWARVITHYQGGTGWGYANGKRIDFKYFDMDRPTIMGLPAYHVPPADDGYVNDRDLNMFGPIEICPQDGGPARPEAPPLKRQKARWLVVATYPNGAVFKRYYDAGWMLLREVGPNGVVNVNYNDQGELLGKIAETGVRTCVAHAAGAGMPGQLPRDPQNGHVDDSLIGEITTITEHPGPGEGSAAPRVSQYSYTSTWRQLDTVVANNTAKTVYVRDAAQRVLAIGRDVLPGRTDWTCYEYADDDVGNALPQNGFRAFEPEQLEVSSDRTPAAMVLSEGPLHYVENYTPANLTLTGIDRGLINRVTGYLWGDASLELNSTMPPVTVTSPSWLVGTPWGSDSITINGVDSQGRLMASVGAPGQWLGAPGEGMVIFDRSAENAWTVQSPATSLTNAAYLRPDGTLEIHSSAFANAVMPGVVVNIQTLLGADNIQVLNSNSITGVATAVPSAPADWLAAYRGGWLTFRSTAAGGWSAGNHGVVSERPQNILGPDAGLGVPSLRSLGGCAASLTVKLGRYGRKDRYPSSIEYPNGSVTRQRELTQFGPQEVTVASETAVPEVRSFTYHEEYGSVLTSYRGALGQPLPGTLVENEYYTGGLLQKKKVENPGAPGQKIITTYGYDNGGSLSSASNSEYSETYATNGLYQLEATKRTPAQNRVGGNAGGVAESGACSLWDLEGRKVEEFLPTGDAIHYSYSTGGDLLAVYKGRESQAVIDQLPQSIIGACHPVAGGNGAMERVAVYGYQHGVKVISQEDGGPMWAYHNDGFGRPIGREYKVCEDNLCNDFGPPNWVNHAEVWGYDTLGRIAWKATYIYTPERFGQQLTSVFDAPNKPAPGDYLTPELQSVVEYTFDYIGRPVRESRWCFYTDENNLRLHCETGAEAVTEYVYGFDLDAKADKLETHLPNGLVRTVLKDGAGRTISDSTPLRGSTYEYQNAGATVKVKQSPAPNQSGYVEEVRLYYPNGALKKVTRGNDILELEYDAFGRVTLERRPGELGRTYQYDSFGNRYAETRTLANQVTATVKRTYDSSGRVSWLYNQNVNGQNQPVYMTVYDYDPQGRLKKVTPSGGFGATELTYGNGTTKVDTRSLPGGTVETYTYDSNSGALAEIAIAPGGGLGPTAGRYRRYTFDDAGRVTAAHVHDQNDLTLNYVTRTYDSLGALRSERQYQGINFKLRYRYDNFVQNDFEMTTINIDDKSMFTTHKVRLVGDYEGKPLEVAFDDVSKATFAYANGSLNQVQHANGVIEDYTYDSVARNTGVHVAKNGTNVAGHDDGLGAGGFPVARQRTIGQGATATDLFTHDGAMRVTYENLGVLNVVLPANIDEEHFVGDNIDHGKPEVTYQLDKDDNWLSQTRTNIALPPFGTAGPVKPDNRYDTLVEGGVAVNLLYDSRGNLQAHDALTFKHDAWGNLVEEDYPGGHSRQYAYDALGRRYSETDENGNTTWLLWNGGEILAEVPQADRTTAQYRLAFGKRTVALTGQATYHIHSDLGGSALAATDASGALKESYNYTSRGATIITTTQGAQVASSTIGNRHLWHGRFYSPLGAVGAGTYLMGARQYWPGMGRFLSPDPIGQAGGVNVYDYAAQATLTYWDPTGLSRGVLRPYGNPYASALAGSANGGLNSIGALAVLPAQFVTHPLDTAADLWIGTVQGGAKLIGAFGDFVGGSLDLLWNDVLLGEESATGRQSERDLQQLEHWALTSNPNEVVFNATTKSTGFLTDLYLGGKLGELGESQELAGSRPPNLTPEGAGRRGAFNEAKRNSDVPTSQQPDRVTPNYDLRGDVQPGRIYEFDVPESGGGVRTVRIRDDVGGHNYGPNNPQNRGPHFNDPNGGHYDY